MEPSGNLGVWEIPFPREVFPWAFLSRPGASEALALAVQGTLWNPRGGDSEDTDVIISPIKASHRIHQDVHLCKTHRQSTNVLPFVYAASDHCSN